MLSSSSNHSHVCLPNINPENIQISAKSIILTPLDALHYQILRNSPLRNPVFLGQVIGNALIMTMFKNKVNVLDFCD